VSTLVKTMSGAMASDSSSRILGRAVRRVLLVLSMMVMLVMGFSSHAGAAAATDCDPSHFITDSGFDITSYELCKNPKTDVTEAAPGAPITFTAAGFAASSEVAVYVHRIGCGDAPECSVFIGYGHTDENGVLIFDFDFPAGLGSGDFEIVAEGLDPSGNPKTAVSAPISVAAEVPDNAGNLPYTGSKTLRLTTIGAALFILGGVALASSRRLRRVRT
jgi:LPXTG cell wall anchor motif